MHYHYCATSLLKLNLQIRLSSVIIVRVVFEDTFMLLLVGWCSFGLWYS